MREKKKEIVKKKLPPRDGAGSETGPRRLLFFLHLPATGPVALVSYLSTIEPHDYPPARNAIGSGETVTLSVSRARVRRVSGQTSSTSTQHRANARHTTTRDGYYRFDVSLFGDERTNERTNDANVVQTTTHDACACFLVNRDTDRTRHRQTDEPTTR